jgi:hypothetical protein
MNVCVLDADRVCVGCRRTLDEIARWGRMSAAEQWAVMARLDQVRRDAPAGAAAGVRAGIG